MKIGDTGFFYNGQWNFNENLEQDCISVQSNPCHVCGHHPPMEEIPVFTVRELTDDHAILVHRMDEDDRWIMKYDRETGLLEFMDRDYFTQK